MLPSELRQTLEGALDAWDDGRDYLGMSAIGQCPLKLFFDLTEGRRKPNWLGRLLCHEGLVHEQDLLARCEMAGLKVIHKGRELVAPFDERFRGHIEGELDGALLEIKTANENGFEQVRWRGAKRKHAHQVQAYMRYGGYDRALIVYKKRETGDLWVVELERDDEIGERLEAKAKAILWAVDEGEAPACECGYCRR